MSASKSEGQFEVLSPWADVDPVPLRGISPRLTDLAGKKIGLFYNIKRSAREILSVVEEKLKARFPTCKFSWYPNLLPPGKYVGDLEGEDKAKFEEWVKGIDAAVSAVGD